MYSQSDVLTRLLDYTFTNKTYWQKRLNNQQIKMMIFTKLFIYILQIWLPDRLLEDHSSMKVVTQTLYTHLLVPGFGPEAFANIWLKLFVIVPKGKPFVDYVFQEIHSQACVKRPYKT